MILGLDFDTRAVHAVLLDDDTNHATYIPVPFVDHKPPFRFDDARAVRDALRHALCTYGDPIETAPYFRRRAPWMDTVWLAGIEKPYSQNTDNAWKYGLVAGQILSCIPARIAVLELPPNDGFAGWKALSVGKTNASKDEIAAWATRELSRAQDAVVLGPQDAMDAYCIARAARALNERGIAAA